MTNLLFERARERTRKAIESIANLTDETSEELYSSRQTYVSLALLH